jgi:hypothetical protein
VGWSFQRVSRDAQDSKDFPNHALQKRLIAFPVAAEESHQAWAKNARNVVTLLKQKAPAGVDDYGASNPPMPRCPHATTALDYRRGSTPAPHALVSHLTNDSCGA